MPQFALTAILLFHAEFSREDEMDIKMKAVAEIDREQGTGPRRSIGMVPAMLRISTPSPQTALYLFRFPPHNGSRRIELFSWGKMHLVGPDVLLALGRVRSPCFRGLLIPSQVHSSFDLLPSLQSRDRYIRLANLSLAFLT